MKYAAGIEVPPRRGATFSVNYSPRRFDRVAKASAFLKTQLMKKRGSCFGEVVSVNVNKDGEETAMTTVRQIVWIPKLAKNFTLRDLKTR